MTTRRSFLKSALAGATALSLGKLLTNGARAGGPPAAGKLVIVFAYGGWDPMWTFDAKPDSPEVDRIPGTMRLFGDLPIWTHAERPNVSSFFKQWASRCAVINGISVESLAHEACADVALTGHIGGEQPDIGARLARELGSDLPLPYLALGAQAEFGGHEAHTGSFGSTNQLMALSTPDLAWPAPGSFSPDRGLELQSAEREATRAYLDQASEQFLQSQEASQRGQRLARGYRESLDRAHRLRDAARSGGVLSDPALFANTDSRWDHVAGALAEGISQVALVQPDYFWDTHAYNETQGGLYNDLFGGLSTLMDSLTSQRIADDTTVLVISEMGRTPRHNTSMGKDHWPWTSAMLIGNQVRGGRAFGATDEWLRPVPIDPSTGAASPNGITIHAGNVLSSTAALLGVEKPDWFGKEALSGLLA